MFSRLIGKSPRYYEDEYEEESVNHDPPASEPESAKGGSKQNMEREKEKGTYDDIMSQLTPRNKPKTQLFEEEKPVITEPVVEVPPKAPEVKEAMTADECRQLELARIRGRAELEKFAKQLVKNTVEVIVIGKKAYPPEEGIKKLAIMTEIDGIKRDAKPVVLHRNADGKLDLTHEAAADELEILRLVSEGYISVD